MKPNGFPPDNLVLFVLLILINLISLIVGVTNVISFYNEKQYIVACAF